MATMFDKVIQDFRTANGGHDDDTTRALMQRQMPEDATEDEILEAIRQIVTAYADAFL